MSRYLYKSTSGKLIYNHSHSGGQDFSCPKRYYWKRVEGYQPREESCALEFGNAIESAIQYYHLNGRQPHTGVDEFSLIWFKQQENQELTYTEKSGNWEDHMRMGKQLMRLYETVLPTLPIENEQFHITFKKNLFENVNTEYSGIGFTAVVDLLSEVDWDHPLLPKLPTPGKRKIVVDIKTSSKEYYQDSRLSALDDQLRDYAWATGIPTVAFLVFVKNHSSVGTGDWVTPMVGEKAGKYYQVLDIDASRAIIVPGALYSEFQTRKDKIKGKGKKEAVDVLLTEYVYRGYRYSVEDITKQKIQFLPAVVSQEDMYEGEQIAKMEAMEISDCSAANFYPKKPSVRWPGAQCLSCPCLGLCIGDEKLTKEKLIKIDGTF